MCASDLTNCALPSSTARSSFVFEKGTGKLVMVRNKSLLSTALIDGLTRVLLPHCQANASVKPATDLSDVIAFLKEDK